MKKLATLLFFILCLSSKITVAQDSSCNAAFNVTYLDGNTLQFNPVNTTGLPSTQHFWYFGDGASSALVSPAHGYLNGSVFTVRQFLISTDSNGTELCRDSFTRIVQVQTTPVPCSLVAGFFSYIDTTVSNNYTFQFVNTTLSSNGTDSIRWTFGDGTASNQLNPAHTYSHSGTYMVCLRVQQRDSLGNLTNCVSEICHTVTIVQVPIPCNLTANFYSYSDTTVATNYTVQFVNTTAPLHSTDSVMWMFGDGTFSSQLNPGHTYSHPGTYTVCLRVQQTDSLGFPTNCLSEICHVVIVNQVPIPCNLTANFYSYTDTTANNNYTLQFVNTSVPLHNTDSVTWTFGDGTSSSQLNPVHTFSQPGTYTVCLKVQQTDSLGFPTNCMSEICHVVTVIQTPVPCTLTAAFYSSVDSIPGTINTYHFINTSTPLNAYDSVRWTFGDGTASNELNPIHVYAQPGTYTVCLRVQKRGPNGIGLTNCISETCHVVTIAATCNIHASYSWTADSSNNRKIIFANLSISSTNPITALWTFGDGTSSTSWNPVHEYAQAGTYVVCLRVQSNANCVGYFCDSIIITAPTNCQQQSNFNFAKANSNSQLYYFTPLSVNNTAQYTWTFGDGTGSHNITASHLYTQPGNYTACLTVYKNANCASTTCRPVQVIQQINCDSVYAYYNYNADSVMPNKIYFHTVANYPVTNERWTITKLTGSSAPVTLNQYNPTYTFNSSGYYRVCLRAETSAGCVKEYCKVIYIANVFSTSTCNLQPYPNPGTNTVSVNVYLNQPQTIDVYIYNALNILVKQKHQQGNPGGNVITLGIASLSPGIYTMKVVHGNAICYAHFVKF